MKKYKNGCYKIKVPLYDVSFWLAPDVDSFVNVTGDEPDKSYAACAGVAPNGNFIVGFFEPPTINTICHESVHMAGIICDYVGIRADWNNDEPLAYLTGYIADKIYSALMSNN